MKAVKMSLTLNAPMYIVLCSNLHITTKQAPKTYQTWTKISTKQSTPN
jgi:hypothetical protein